MSPFHTLIGVEIDADKGFQETHKMCGSNGIPGVAFLLQRTIDMDTYRFVETITKVWILNQSTIG